MDRGQSLIILPLFDGTNYAYWKVCMRAFLQSLDEKVWQVVEIGWTKPKEVPVDWDDAKIKVANFNRRALNALFNEIMNEEFKKISSIGTEKEAWTILQTTYEGTKVVKNLKFQRLITSFEKIKMEEDESFDEFYAKLKEIVNLSFNLEETIPEPKIIRKVLKSLPERFHTKIIEIKESKEIDKIPLTELVGNLQTYELGLTRIRKSSKGKSMTLMAKSSDTDESLDNEDAKMKSYITRQFKNLSFNLKETIPEPKIVRKVLRSLPERFHAKITAIEESKDINKILLTELVGNLQTYQLGLTRIGKSSKGKSMTLKAKSSDTDESSDNEDSKMKSYITQ